MGHLFQNPSINFQALQIAMRKVWRNDNVVVKPLENGIYSFTYSKEEEKNRVLNGGPWSFSNNLLMLKTWELDISPHCYEFNKCAFWVRILGLPLKWKSEAMVTKNASMVGQCWR